MGEPWPMDPQSPDAKRLADEVTYWRQDAAARLDMALTLAKAAQAKGDLDEASRLTVLNINPTFAALRGALSGDLHWPCCEGCEQPVKDGDAVFTYTEGEVAHVDCGSPKLASLPEHASQWAEDQDLNPEGIRQILARAEAFMECRDDG